MSASESKRRWFYPKPGWLVLSSLAVTGILFLSQEYCLPGFCINLTLLLVIASVGVMLLAILLWFLAALLFRWRFQFTIRSLLLLVVAVAIPCSWIGDRMRQAKRQLQGIALVERIGGAAYVRFGPSELQERLQSVLPAVFFDDVDIVKFDSKHNSLSDADLSEVVRLLPRIEVLKLDTTAVTDAGLRSLGGLKDLVVLTLNNTKITDAGLEVLRNTKNVRALELDGTSVTDAGIEGLTGHKLWRLCLSGTKVTDSGMANILGYKTDVLGHELTSLTLNNTGVSDAGLKHVEDKTEVESLLLSGTMITDAVLDHIRGLHDLRELDLSRTKITDGGLERLESVTTLLILDLSGTQITDAGLECLRRMDQLQMLNLANTSVTDRGLERLAALKPEGLGCPAAKLSLVGTKTTKAGVKKLQQAWPDYTIER